MDSVRRSAPYEGSRRRSPDLPELDAQMCAEGKAKRLRIGAPLLNRERIQPLLGFRLTCDWDQCTAFVDFTPVNECLGLLAATEAYREA